MKPIDALQVMGVQNHGLANQERIAIYVHQMCDLSQYCLVLTLPTPAGGWIPVKDHMLWFGNGWANPGDWIFVYTGGGETTISPNPGAPLLGMVPSQIINLHWGKQHTVFQNRALNPMLIQIAGTAVPIPAAPAYQGTTQETAWPWLKNQ